MVDTIFSHPAVFAVVVLLPLFGIAAKAFGFSFQRIAKWYCYIAVFAAAIVMDSIFFPFISGKDYFFRFSVELALIFACLWWAFEAKSGEVELLVKGLFKKPIVWAVSAFAAAYLLACLFAYDMHAAFWSNYERGEGGFQMLHYYVFFILLLLLLREVKDWKRIFGFSLVTAGLMIVYGMMANWGVSGFIGAYSGGVAPSGWWHQLVDGRFQGTLGNPAYVDPYLIFSMFYAGYLWVERSIAGKLTQLAAWSYGVLIAIFGFFFILGQTRGAFLGLAAGVFIGLAYLVFQESSFIRKLCLAIVLIPAVLAFAIELFLGRSFLGSVLVASIVAVTIGTLTFLVCLAFSKHAAFRKWFRIILAVLGILVVLAVIAFAVFVHSVSAIESVPEARLIQISASDASAQTRFWVWGEAWHGFLERPIFGWGPENFTTVFDKFFNPNFYIPGQNAETWFDRAHSVFFDYLAETGIVGFLAYISMFVLFFVEFFRRHKRKVADAGKRSTAMLVEHGLILAVPIAYLVQGVAIFDVFPMYLNVFLFLGFVGWYFSQRQTTNSV